MTRRSSATAVATAVVLIVAASGGAFSPKEPRDQLDLLVFQAPELRVVETPVDAVDIRDSVPNIDAVDAFRAQYGAAWTVRLDARRGVPTLVGGGAIPFIPGGANDLEWRRFAPGCTANECIPVDAVEPLARDFLQQWQDLFRVAGADLVLDPDGSGPFEHMYYLRFAWHLDGIPVERGSVFFRINRGNLIQIATTGIGPVVLDPVASIDSETARAIVADYLGPFRSDADTFHDKGSLKIIPVTPDGVDPNRFSGPVGGGVDYRLVRRVVFERSGVIGTWEALVDAHTAELLRFVDLNRYGRVHGGAYPGDNHTGEADRPFAFADIGGGQFADAGGLFPGDSATVTLNGKYTWIDDSCGAVNGTTGDGDVDLGIGPAGQQDCAVPVGNTAGAGNTHSARTQYYHLTNVNIKARTFMPSNSWLNNDHMNVNTNQSPWCNATSGGGTLNFYKASTGCWNLGELPAVSLHEWGHSMDDFDGSGSDSPPVETRADWTAMLQTHDSCVGRGFFLTGNCSGYGDSCLDCNGVRDNDWEQHTSLTPWTPANHGTFWSCSGGSYFGPCGFEDHCEAGLSTQALWDFVTRDAVDPVTKLDLATAWQLADRLFYLAMPTLGDLYTCTPPQSNGCNGGSLYSTMTAIDDDGDGTANGTPHAAAIFAALARHNIACGLISDPANQNVSSCPLLAKPEITLQAGSDAATVEWTAVPDAQRYLVFRNDIGCDAGFTEVGEATAPATSFVDTTVVNGIPYSYRVQAVTDTDSCASLMSDCSEVTPQPCAGAVSLDRATYSCSGVVAIRVVDSDLTGTGTLDVTAWSDSEPAGETVTLVESPPASGIFVGSVATTTAVTGGDGAVGVVHDDAITVRYHDASYCGPPQDVDAGAVADCQAPVISGVTTSEITGFNAIVDWLTDEPADSRVTYDPVVVESVISDDDYVTVHGLELLPLAECTEYVYSVTSTDPAGNASTDDNGGGGYTFRTFKNTQPTYTATDTPVTIPDDTSPGATSVIAVPDDKAVVDVDVHVDITHTYDGDLSLHLEGPNGVEIVLSDRHGGGSNDYTGTVFDDEATNPIASGTPPFTGSFSPDEALSTFDGVTAAGDWTLRVEDHAGVDTGTIDGFALTLTFAAEVCPTSDGWIDLDQDVYGCNATITVTVQDQDLEGGGTLAVELESTTEASPETVMLSEVAPGVFEGAFPATPDPAVPGDGALSVVGGDLITGRYIDADTGAGQGVPKTDTATADCQGPAISGVAVVDVTGHTATVSWTTSEPADTTLAWDQTTPPAAHSWHDDTMVSNHSVEVTGLDACTDYWFAPSSADVHGNLVTDTNGGAYWFLETVAEDAFEAPSSDTPAAIPDVSQLLSVVTVPSALTVADVDVRVDIVHTYDDDLDMWLIGPNGVQVELSTDNGGTGEDFDDTVFDDEAATPITAGSPPYAGAYQPEGSLAALDGIAATGDWTLKIVDDAGGDVGTLESWSLLLTLAGGSCDGGEIFADGFESGDDTAWSSSTP